MRVLVCLVAAFIFFTSGWVVVWTDNQLELELLKLYKTMTFTTDQSDFFVNFNVAVFVWMPDNKFAVGIMFDDALNTSDMFVYGTLFVPLLMLLLAMEYPSKKFFD